MNFLKIQKTQGPGPVRIKNLENLSFKNQRGITMPPSKKNCEMSGGTGSDFSE